MPVVPASNLPYSGAPDVEPQVGVPSNYQTQRASPEAFGGQVGAAVSQLGERIGQAGNMLAENAIRRQELENQVRADDATNKYQETETKLLYGDPAVPGDTGFFGKRGEDAMRALPDVRSQLVKLRDGMRGDLVNPRQQLMFDQETRRLQAYSLARMGSHYDQEFQRYSVGVADAKIHNAGTQMAQAIATDDSEQESAAVANQMKGELDKLALTGMAGNQDAVNAALQRVRGNYVKMKVEGVAQKNPYAALDYLDKNKDALNGDEYNQLHRVYRAQAATIAAQVDAGIITGPTGQLQGNPYGSPHSSGWGPLAQPAIDAFQKAGASPAFIEAAMANGLAEGGFKDNWQKAWGREESYGHWQYNNNGELPRYLQEGGDKSTGSQAAYLMKRMEEIEPGITKSNDAKRVLDVMATQFEKYQGAEAGQRYPFLEQARQYMHSAAVDQGRASTGGGQFLGVGDSIAAHLIRKAGVQGKEYNFDKKDDSTAVSGWGPAAIANMVDHLPDTRVKGQDVVLSTGASNAGGDGKLADSDLNQIGHQIDVLKAKGAKSVTVLGVGTRADFAGRNEQLAQLATQHGAVPAGPIDPNNIADDGVHAKNPTALLAQVRAVQPQQQDTVQGAAAAPLPGMQQVSGPDKLVPALKPLPKLDFPLPAIDPGELPDNQVPGMADALKHIMDTVPADDVVKRMNAVKAARTFYNNQYQEQQRQLKIHNEQLKTQSQAREDQYLQRMGTGQEPTVQEVLTDKYLLPESKRTMVGFIERQGKTDPVAAVSKQNVVGLFGRMTQPDGTEGKITTEDPLKEAYKNQEITRQDYDWVTKQFRDQRAPGGENLQRVKSEWFNAIKHKVYGLAATLDPKLDPSSGIRMFDYQQFVDSEIDRYQKAGKNPMDLFNRKNSDYVGSDETMKQFAPTPKATAAAAGKAQQVDIGSMSDSQVAAWVRSQGTPEAWDQGAAELLKRHPELANKPKRAPIE